MKRRVILSFAAISLLVTGTAAGQSRQGKATKKFSMAAKVSQDGKLLLSGDGQSWPVANPNMLVGHEGKQVKVKYQLIQDSHNIQVLSLKLETQNKYAVNLGDSAYRR